MDEEARYDAEQRPFVPDRHVVALAHNLMMDEEDEGPPSRTYVRHRWEEAFGASRVAMMALRDIYPAYRDEMNPQTRASIEEALTHAEGTFMSLDDCATDMTTELVQLVQRGLIRDEQALKTYLEGRDGE